MLDGLQIFFGIVFLFLAFVVLTWMVGLIRHLLALIPVRDRVATMNSGLFVEHGMVFDKNTGLPRPQKKPSAQAYRRLS